MKVNCLLVEKSNLIPGFSSTKRTKAFENTAGKGENTGHNIFYSFTDKVYPFSCVSLAVCL